MSVLVLVLAVAGICAAVAVLAYLVNRQEDTGHHPRPRRSLRPRALWSSFELWLRWWNWWPVQAHWYRQYKRVNRRELERQREQVRAYGRHAATLPRRKPIVGRQPWTTMQIPAVKDDEPGQAAA